MNVLTVFSFTALAVLTALCVKSVRAEYALIVSLVSSVLLSLALLVPVADILTEASALASAAQVDEKMLSVLFKALGTGYLCRFVCELCDSAGEKGLCAKAEMAEKIYLVTLCLPLIRRLLSLVAEVGGA